jgi:peptidyl-prolyl cis-trans isomerase A (cyclophilin A)
MTTRLPRLLAFLTLVIAGACARPASLVTPDAKRVDAVGPDSFTVHVVSSKGPFDIRIHRDWAPRASDRLYFLFGAHYYDGVRFFRTVDNFVTQFGISGDTAVSRVWSKMRIKDDTVLKSNVRGTLSFAAGGKDTRTTQLFISYRDNSRLDATGFAVFGQVIAGMNVVDSLYKGYGEGAPRGQGPSQGKIQSDGNAYLIKDFPRLDYIITARITEQWRAR